MLTETALRRLEQLGELSRQGKRVNGLFRLMECPLLWDEAYARIYANDGATTQGVDHTTLDGFSHERVSTLIALLKSGQYQFHPTRRVYVPKANGKTRPLGIPSGNDKLIQEVVRGLLERIYEPIFENSSHGFRPNRSCHTALQRIADQWTAIKWLVEVDLKSYFDTIDHALMIRLLEKKIDDPRFIKLIEEMLQAGYLEDWTFHQTYSGTPQGSICSPILANIYLHELDLFMDTLRDQFNQGKKRHANKGYAHYTGQVTRLRKQWDALKEQDAPPEEIQAVRRQLRRVEEQRRDLPCGDPFDETYKRLFYCRYADDFAIGMIGSKADAEMVMAQVKGFVEQQLKLAISEEKSGIRHGKEGMIFLGYWVGIYSGQRVIKTRRGTHQTRMKSTSERIQLPIPQEKLQAFCQERRYGIYQSAGAVQKKELTNLSDAEIVLMYNAELRGLANYYALAHNAKSDLNKLAYIWQGSLWKTLAAKHQISVTKIARQLKTKNGYVLEIEQNHRRRSIPIFQLKHLRIPVATNQKVDWLPNTTWTLSRTEIIRRLNAKHCEYCGSECGPFEVHHIRKMKDVKDGKAIWQRVMMARRRKTLVLCASCHHLLHAGKLPPPPENDSKKKGGESRMR